MAAVLLVLGALMMVAGVAVVAWPWALVTAGVLCLAAGFDLSRSA